MRRSSSRVHNCKQCAWRFVWDALGLYERPGDAVTQQHAQRRSINKANAGGNMSLATTRQGVAHGLAGGSLRFPSSSPMGKPHNCKLRAC
jgi:hypothetical protein